MKAVETGLDGCLIVEPQVFGDDRGWFYEAYSKRKFEALGIDAEFVQDNRSYSSLKGTLRGLHCQSAPEAQAKLVCCTRGAIRDVAVDIRKGSPTYMKWISVELSADNKKMLFIPKGFLHGYVTLTDDAEVFYKTDAHYSPENDRSVRYDDAAIGVDWGVEAPVLSPKDGGAPTLADSGVTFDYGWESKI